MQTGCAIRRVVRSAAARLGLSASTVPTACPREALAAAAAVANAATAAVAAAVVFMPACDGRIFRITAAAAVGRELAIAGAFSSAAMTVSMFRVKGLGLMVYGLGFGARS